MQQKALELIEQNGWRFSKIDGDPVLGKGVKCYATKHFSAKENVDTVIRNMNYLAVVNNGLSRDLNNGIGGEQ